MNVQHLFDPLGLGILSSSRAPSFEPLNRKGLIPRAHTSSLCDAGASAEISLTDYIKPLRERKLFLARRGLSVKVSENVRFELLVRPIASPRLIRLAARAGVNRFNVP